jgi:hypothetical protein
MHVPLRALNGLPGVNIAWDAGSRSVVITVESKVTRVQLELAKLPRV